MEILDFLEDDGQGDSIVCHYTSKRIVLENILPSLKIRFSPLRETNDPRENKERLFRIGYRYSDGMENEIKQKYYPTRNQLQEILLDFSKVLCLTESSRNNPYKLNTKRAFGRPRMWSQYGDKHKGICLVFDRKKLENDIKSVHQSESKEIFCGSVQYQDYLKTVSLNCNDFNYDRVKEIGYEGALIEHIIKFKDALFFRKDSDWSDEYEWRWILHKWTKGYEYVSIEKSLKGIILGVDFSTTYLPSIKNYSDKLGVEAIQLDWDSTKEDFYFKRR